jgi:hypothetical protein
MDSNTFKSSVDFILELVSLLKKRKDADLEIINILENNILKNNISSDALSQSIEEIKKLAEKRATTDLSSKNGSN